MGGKHHRKQSIREAQQMIDEHGIGGTAVILQGQAAA
jgi:hypothetical protein